MGIVIWALIVLLIAVLLFAIIVWRIGVISQSPRKLLNNENPAVDTKWQSITFESNGSKLEGWLLQPIAKAAFKEVSEAASNETDVTIDGSDLLPLVIIAHGWGSNRTRVLRYARPLYEAGFAVLMYDARSHGDSESIKAPSALMFRDDVQAAVHTARSLSGINPNRIAVIGHSLGGFGAILALGEGLRVNAVVTDSMPVRFETMIRAELNRKKTPAFPLVYLIPYIWLLRARITRQQFRAANIRDILLRHAGSAITGLVPVLMVHSKGDDFIYAEDLQQLEEQLPPGTIDTLYVSSRGHSTSETDPLFWERVIPFLKEALF